MVKVVKVVKVVKAVKVVKVVKMYSGKFVKQIAGVEDQVRIFRTRTKLQFWVKMNDGGWKCVLSLKTSEFITLLGQMFADEGFGSQLWMDSSTKVGMKKILSAKQIFRCDMCHDYVIGCFKHICSKQPASEVELFKGFGSLLKQRGKKDKS